MLPAGNLLVVSTHTKEIHEEVHSFKCLDSCIVDMAYCPSLNKAGITWTALVLCCLHSFKWLDCCNVDMAYCPYLDEAGIRWVALIRYCQKLPTCQLCNITNCIHETQHPSATFQ